MSAAEFTAADVAEQAGAAIAGNCLADMQGATSQAERVTLLQTALLGLQRLPYPDRAAGGFAVALVATLDQGLGYHETESDICNRPSNIEPNSESDIAHMRETDRQRVSELPPAFDEPLPF